MLLFIEVILVTFMSLKHCCIFSHYIFPLLTAFNELTIWASGAHCPALPLQIYYPTEFYHCKQCWGGTK